MKPRMSSTAQSTLPAQPKMSLGPMLTTITDGSNPAARCVASHTDMLAPGLLATSLPAWNPTPAAMCTGPQPRSDEHVSERRPPSILEWRAIGRAEHDRVAHHRDGAAWPGCVDEHRNEQALRRYVLRHDHQTADDGHDD